MIANEVGLVAKYLIAYRHSYTDIASVTESRKFCCDTVKNAICYVY